MQNKEIQRLLDVLERRKTLLGSWAKLESDIHAANDKDKDRRVDRRALQGLCEGRFDKDGNPVRVLLSLDHIQALDTWLVARGETPLLAKRRSLIDSFRGSFSVNFLIGAKFNEDWSTEVISRWDVRATTRLMRTPLNQLHVRIHDTDGRRSWRDEDIRIGNSANIGIASPVASYGSQVIMSRMVGISPDEPVDFTELPFFIVGSERDEKLTHSFVRPRSEIAGSGRADWLPEGREGRSLVIGGKCFRNNGNADYALLLAQRDPKSGHAQMVLCGLTGRGTYRLSRILHAGEPAQTLPAHEAGQDRPPIFAVVFKLTMDPEDDDSSDHADFKYKAKFGPCLINQVDGKWKFQQ